MVDVTGFGECAYRMGWCDGGCLQWQNCCHWRGEPERILRRFGKATCSFGG